VLVNEAGWLVKTTDQAPVKARMTSSNATECDSIFSIMRTWVYTGTALIFHPEICCAVIWISL
jgi:hypothetical protein